MTTFQNALDFVKDQMDKGAMSVKEANVQLIRMVGVRILIGSIPASTRKDLMEAVKDGSLGRLKKGHLRPEIFFHPNSRARAIEEQEKSFRDGLEAIAKICK